MEPSSLRPSPYLDAQGGKALGSIKDTEAVKIAVLTGHPQDDEFPEALCSCEMRAGLVSVFKGQGSVLKGGVTVCLLLQ